MSAMLMPSMMMAPPAASRILNNDNVSDDFPAPVRPTTPTCTINNVNKHNKKRRKHFSNDFPGFCKSLFGWYLIYCFLWTHPDKLCDMFSGYWQRVPVASVSAANLYVSVYIISMRWWVLTFCPALILHVTPFKTRSRPGR